VAFEEILNRFAGERREFSARRLRGRPKGQDMVPALDLEKRAAQAWKARDGLGAGALD